MRQAVIDEHLSARIVAMRELRYSTATADADDRPPHVRAASGMAFVDGRLVLVQDDAAFLAIVDPRGEPVEAIALPYAPGGRRRFEVGLGNKLDKLDLEACVVIDRSELSLEHPELSLGRELWAFGSGALPVRERVCRLALDTFAPVLVDASPLYAAVRAAIGSTINLEGVALVRDELWLCHRGNTGSDDPGPAIARVRLDEVRAAFEGTPPRTIVVDRYDLGSLGGSKLGFTDATAIGDRVFYLAAAESSPDAIDDGPVTGSQLGVISEHDVRATPLSDPDGLPIKAEGLALDPAYPTRAWVSADPDDPDRPAPLYQLELRGPW